MARVLKTTQVRPEEPQAERRGSNDDTIENNHDAKKKDVVRTTQLSLKQLTRRDAETQRVEM